MKAIIDKREIDHRTYLRVNLSYDVDFKVINYLNIKKPTISDGCYLFEYKDDSLTSLLSFLEKLFERFDISYVYEKSILDEIENFKKEQKSFEEFSLKAFKIRNNQFDNIAELELMYKDFEKIIVSTMQENFILYNFSASIWPMELIQ